MLCAVCGCNDRNNCKYAIASDIYYAALKRAMFGEVIKITNNLKLSMAILEDLRINQQQNKGEING